MMERQQSDRLMKLATYASVSVAMILVLVKTFTWWRSESVAMLGSLTDSGLDFAASLITLLAVRTAIMPADEAHRFGHGKAEALSGLFQAALMATAAMFLVLNSLGRLWAPSAVTATETMIGVSLFAIALSLVLVSFQAYVIKKTGSIAVTGDHLHYKGDILLNLAVVASALFAMNNMFLADGFIGLAIGGFILWSAIGVAKPATDMLMDREFSGDEREQIFNTVMESPGVLGLHDLRTRAAGRDKFIQMHIEVDGELSVRKAHFIADEVEATVGELYPDAEILIHVDPLSEQSDDLTHAELPNQKDEYQ